MLRLLAALILFTSNASAMVTTQTVDDVDVTVYSPDWTWQRQDINVLVVLRNEGDVSKDVTLALALPTEKEDHFSFEQEATVTITVEAHSESRHAFTAITALGDVPRQVYDFTVTASTPNDTLDIVYPVRTVRGAVVSTRRWAALLPAGLAALWCIVFGAVLLPMSEKNAWRTPSDPIVEAKK